MAARAKAESNNGGIMDPVRGRKTSGSATRRAQSLRVADTIQTSRDFAGFMSLLIGDIVSGRIDARTANAACNAGGKLLRVVELEYKLGRKKEESGDRVLQLAAVP